MIILALLKSIKVYDHGNHVVEDSLKSKGGKCIYSDSGLKHARSFIKVNFIDRGPLDTQRWVKVNTMCYIVSFTFPFLYNHETLHEAGYDNELRK